MAVNVIDAFIVTFGLDARQYKSGEREVRDSLKNTRESAKKTFDEVEDRGEKASVSFRRVRNEVVGLVLAFAGAKSATEFSKNLLGGVSSASRLGETIGLSTQRLIAWQEAVRQVGGQEGEATAALQGIASAIQSYKLTGTTGADADFRGLGITNSDLLTKDPSEILLKIAEAGERLGKPEFAARLQRIGIPQSTIYLLEQGRQKLEAQLKEAEKNLAITQKNEEAAKRFDEALAKLETTIKGKALPYVTAFVEGLTDLFNSVQQNTDGLPSFSDALVGVGVVAAIVGAPFVALAAAIALVATNYEELKKTWSGFEGWWKGVQNGADAFFDPIRKRLGLKTGAEAERDGTDVFGNPLSLVKRGSSAGAAIAPRADLSAPRVRQSANYIETYLQRAGLTPEQARGVAAGLFAESGFNPSAVNPTSGAYGIGQWLGDRKKALFARYGNRPTLDQQLAFLVSELRGGDRGGPSVLQSSTADRTLLAFVTNFLRPGVGTLGDLQRGRAYIARGGARGGVTIGSINVYPRSGDPQVIARETANAIQRRVVVTQADGGVAP